MINKIITLIIVISSFIIAAFNVPITGQAIGNDFINFEKLYAGVLILRTGNVYPDQIVAVKSEKGIVIFDTGISPTLTKEYRKIIEQEFPGDKISYVVNTHHHFDHTNGNQIFADATIIAHENCPGAMLQFSENKEEFVKSRRERYLRRNELAETLDTSSDLYKRLKDLVFMSGQMCDDLESIFQLTLPDIIFSDQLEIDLGDMTLRLFHFPPGFHTNNDIIAVIPELGLIFTGDILPEIEPTASITSKHNLEDALKVLDDVIQCCGEIKNVVTIHDGVLPPSVFFNFKNNLSAMLTDKQTKKSAVLKIEESLAEIEMDKLKLMLNEMITNDDYYLLEGDLIELADRNISEGKKEIGLALFELSSEMFPGSANSFEWLGDAYFQIGNYEKAKASFQRALKLYPVDSFAADMIYQIEKKLNDS